ncbi:hypothetical protein [Thaumasiovibrio subtropicus]|uniref:hypothetical protein n=1 Tax=Thaumasiovibrio subtropicus TaxID=1891207 RepID=UPI000B3596E6|nr:hypothetical protein [Thaumasiovibrio subtropicus]
MGHRSRATAQTLLVFFLLFCSSRGYSSEHYVTYHQDEGEYIPGATYSYFYISSEHVNYAESLGAIPVRSDATVRNMAVHTGGVYDINRLYAFSVDAHSTFYPTASEEQWTRDGVGVYQRNQFEFSSTTTSLLLHYKFDPGWRILAGTSFMYTVYKRSDVLLPSQAGPFQSGVIEEKSSEFVFITGAAYEHGTLGDQWRYGGKATFGLPIWSITESSLYPGLEFDHHGYLLGLEGNVSYQIVSNLHIAMFGQLTYRIRDEEPPQAWRGDLGDGEKNYLVSLPKGETSTLNLGVGLLWSF